MEINKPEILDLGICAKHNMACAVCHENHAVLNMHNGVFLPCWSCQKKGYQLIYSPRLFKFLKFIGALE
jgi:hypothetical protein